ncbi:MAG TPA: hypothetical protein VF789_01380 [Thermoanaerobaculia bacterium]
MVRPRAWFVLLTVLAVVVLAAGVFAAPKPQANSLPAGSQLEAVAFRVIDEKVAMKAWVSSRDAKGWEVRRELAARDGIEWTVVKGDGKLFEDPGTGMILFKPVGREPLVVQAKLGNLVSEPIRVGLDPATVNSFEHHPDSPEAKLAESADSFDAAGGGLCGHRNGPRMFEEPVDVRSVVSASIIPLSATERVVRYAFGDYYSYHPKVGPMQINYNPNKISEVRLKSLSPTGDPFFPATAEGDLYFIIKTLRNGMKIANPEPMTVHATVMSWPPFETPVVNDKGVRFFDMMKPDVEVHRIAYQELYLYPTRELTVDLVSSKIEKGVLTAVFDIKNVSPTAGDIRWFLIGDLNKPLTPAKGLVRLEPGRTHRVTFSSRLAPTALPQHITLGAVSQSGPRMLGYKGLDFQRQRSGDDRFAGLVDQSSKLRRGDQRVARAAGR